MVEYKINLDPYWDIRTASKGFIPHAAGASVVDQENNRAYYYGGFAQGGTTPRGLYSMDLDSLEIKHHFDLDLPGRMNHQLLLNESGQLLILGGYYQNQPQNDLLIVHPEKGILQRHVFEEEALFGQQQTAFYQAPYIYVYGGFYRDRFFRIHTQSFAVEDLSPKGRDARAGMISQLLPTGKAFIFSGFSYGERGPVCHNNYYLYDPEENQLEQRECNEVCGRTFARSFSMPGQKKILIALGTINGMELSGAFYYYDWEKDHFNRLFIQSLPGERAEPLVFYSEKNRQCHILGGGIPGPEYEFLEEHIILDFNRVPQDAWEFH